MFHVKRCPFLFAFLWFKKRPIAKDRGTLKAFNRVLGPCFTQGGAEGEKRLKRAVLLRGRGVLQQKNTTEGRPSQSALCFT